MARNGDMICFLKWEITRELSCKKKTTETRKLSVRNQNIYFAGPCTLIHAVTETCRSTVEAFRLSLVGQKPKHSEQPKTATVNVTRSPRERKAKAKGKLHL